MVVSLCIDSTEWNMHTLMGSAGSDRLQQRTAQVGRELGRYKVEIGALSETRLAEKRAFKRTVLVTLSSGVDARKKSKVK